jgi:hypothetical protein
LCRSTDVFKTTRHCAGLLSSHEIQSTNKRARTCSSPHYYATFNHGWRTKHSSSALMMMSHHHDIIFAKKSAGKHPKSDFELFLNFRPKSEPFFRFIKNNKNSVWNLFSSFIQAAAVKI